MSLITYLTRIHFADRVLEDALPEEMRRLKASMPLLVSDRDAIQAGTLDRLEDALPVPSSATTIRLGAITDADDRALHGHASGDVPVDMVIGHGGILALNAARAIARARCVPVITIPTTPAAIGVEPTDDNRPVAMPDAVLCDPTLLAGLARSRAAETGFDALSHAVEAYLANADNPPADGMALEAVRRARGCLVRWVENRGADDAPREMMAVAINAGLAARKGLGAIEALARAIDTATRTPEDHGRWHGALMLPVLRFNEPAIAPRLPVLATALSLGDGKAVAEGLGDLCRQLGLPTGLRTLSLGDHVLDRIAECAAGSGASRANPRHVATVDYRAMLQAAH